MKIKSIFLIAAVVSVVGCASPLYEKTEPVNSVTGHEVELEKAAVRFSAGNQTPPAKLIVARDKGYFASSCTSWIYLSGDHVATLGEAEYFRAYLKPGDYTLKVINKDCLAYDLDLDLSLVADEQQAYRIMFDGSGLFAEEAIIKFEFREYQEK